MSNSNFTPATLPSSPLSPLLSCPVSPVKGGKGVKGQLKNDLEEEGATDLTFLVNTAFGQRRKVVKIQKKECRIGSSAGTKMQKADT